LPKAFDEAFSGVWREAVRALTDAHYEATEVQKTTLFALARSEQRWRATKEKFSRFLRVTAAA
jgi:hypothetical protein